MTKQLRYLFMLLLSMMVSAHAFAAGNLITEQVTVDVATAGTLSSKIPEADKYRITNLKLTGELNVRDIMFIRQMAGCYYDTGSKYPGKLQHLDLGGAKFVGESEFDVYDSYGPCTAKFTSNAVGYYVFFDLEHLQSIVLPNGLQTIGNRAFWGCKSLSSVSFSVGLQSIGGQAFEYCSSLSSVSLPVGLQSIGNGAFHGCSSLSSVTLPDGLQSIGGQAFCGCSSLSFVSFPDGLQTIGFEAFWGCKSLSSVSLPKSLTEIGSSAFRLCNGVTSLKVDEENPNFTSEGTILFNKDKTTLIEGIGNITEYSIPATVTKIGFCAFEGCSSLSSVSLPEGLQTIGHFAFSNCESLSSVSFPVGLQTIGNNAFDGCTSLSSVSLPDGLQTIGEWAFVNCSSLNSVSFPVGLQTIGNSAFDGCESLSSVSLPDGLQTIGGGAFSYCSSLASVSFPVGLQSIGHMAFYGCSSLASVYVNMKVPAKIEEKSFDDNTKQNATLYVPQGCIEKYEAADYWRNFYNIKEIGTHVGIDSVSAHDAAKEVSRYGINGQLLNGPTKGVNIVKYSDGSVKKVAVE